ncbi:MAG TPA: cupredoxin domain-containing protein [Allosphingosinicella sp.]|nr:cupredoxin domain-containing protein [Allosphingosinicella sp.]
MKLVHSLPLLAVLAAAPAAAQSPDWGHARRVEVALSNFAFSPKTIHLRAGQPVVLHLVNKASGGHDFTAPAFFAAARLRNPKGVPGGSVELGGHKSADIAIVPKAGRYPLKCGHLFHKTFGMTGEILVD